jgi:hypothetical protein
MGEGTEDGSGCGIPGDCPVSVGLDNFGGFSAAHGEVKDSDGGGDFVICESGEKS